MGEKGTRVNNAQHHTPKMGLWAYLEFQAMWAANSEFDDLAIKLGKTSFDEGSRKRRGFLGLIPLLSNLTLNGLTSTACTYSSIRRRSKDSHTRVTTPNGSAGIRSSPTINVSSMCVTHFVSLFTIAADFVSIAQATTDDLFAAFFAVISRGR